MWNKNYIILIFYLIIWFYNAVDLSTIHLLVVFPPFFLFSDSLSQLWFLNLSLPLSPSLKNKDLNIHMWNWEKQVFFQKPNLILEGINNKEKFILLSVTWTSIRRPVAHPLHYWKLKRERVKLIGLMAILAEELAVHKNST